MSVKSIKWKTGEGYIYISQDSGMGDATLSISSDANIGHRREQRISLKSPASTSGDFVTSDVLIKQGGWYDGKFASTNSEEYIKGLDGGNASQL